MFIAYVFATLWVPSLNLVGRSSISAFAVSLLALVLTEKWGRNDRNLDLAISIVLFPLILFRFVTASGAVIADGFSHAVFWPYRSFPNAADFWANYIYLAVGLVISFRVWHLSSTPFRILGTLEGLSLAVLIVAQAVALYRLNTGFSG